MHGPITAAPDGRTLLRDGTPFFWLADTCWSAFTSISDQEWEDYLNLRAEQGFTVLQLNTLAQWDRCSTPRGPAPLCHPGRHLLRLYPARPCLFRPCPGHVPHRRGKGLYPGAGGDVVQLCAGYLGRPDFSRKRDAGRLRGAGGAHHLREFPGICAGVDRQRRHGFQKRGRLHPLPPGDRTGGTVRPPACPKPTTSAGAATICRTGLLGTPTFTCTSPAITGPGRTAPLPWQNISPPCGPAGR